MMFTCSPVLHIGPAEQSIHSLVIWSKFSNPLFAQSVDFAASCTASAEWVATVA